MKMTSTSPQNIFSDSQYNPNKLESAVFIFMAQTPQIRKSAKNSIPFNLKQDLLECVRITMGGVYDFDLEKALRDVQGKHPRDEGGASPNCGREIVT